MRDLPDRNTVSSERHKAGLRVLREQEKRWEGVAKPCC